MAGCWPKNFTRHTLSHFGHPLMVIEKILVTTRMGDWRNLVSPLCGDQRIFGCKRCGDQIFFDHLSLWRLKLFGCHKKGVCHMFLESPHYGDQKYLVTIGHWQSFGWWSKKFSRHLTHPHHWMVMKNIRSLKKLWACVIILEKKPLLSFLGDWKFLVTIQWWGHVGWWWKKFGHLLHSDCGNWNFLVATEG